MLYEQLNILINETTAMADCLKTVKKVFRFGRSDKKLITDCLYIRNKIYI